MVNWKNKIEDAIVASAKYAFIPVGGKYPEADEKEMWDFIGFIMSLIYEERRQCFFTGYKTGLS